MSFGAACWPFVVCAQERKTLRLAWIVPSGPIELMTESAGNPYNKTFFEALRALGWEEGRNLAIERWSGEGVLERYADVAREAVRTAPDIIFSVNTTMTGHLATATSSIPIVTFTFDPVAFGLAESFARPGRNITGLSMQLDIAGKYFELLRTVKPDLARVGVLTPAPQWDAPFGRRFTEIANQLGLVLLGPPLGNPIGEEEYRRVVAAMAEQGAEGLVVPPWVENSTHQAIIVELAAKHRLPALYGLDRSVRMGGLMGYATDTHALFRRAAGYIDRIAKGAKPAEMPFYENTKYDLIINLKTAKALGLTIPESLLARADEVIE
jgi:putative ABC transport system substrate-binding protein